ncbi:MAG: YciI family protein [Pseudomonadota bacterium]
MLFAMIGIDKMPEGVERRKSVRREHLEYIKSLGEKVKFAGPMMSDDGQTIAGSFILFEAVNKTEVEDMLAKDPYTSVDLYETVDIRPFKVLFNNL